MSATRTICIDLLGIPESEAAAYVFVKRMKIMHCPYTPRELVEFRPLIWKRLLQNSRIIVMGIRSRNLGPISSSSEVS